MNWRPLDATARFPRQVALLLATSALMAWPPAASAADGSLVVTATVLPRMSVSFPDSEVSFSGNQTTIEDVVSLENGTGGAPGYMMWRRNGAGAILTVRSNTAWSGAISAAPRSSSAAVALASGGVRYSLVQPESASDCSSAPILTGSPQEWSSSHPKGVSSFDFYYCVRTDPAVEDDPVSFAVSFDVHQEATGD